MFFIGVCRLLGGLLSVACGMYRYTFLWVCVDCLGGCPYCLHSLYISSSLLFLCFSPLFCTILLYSSIFEYGRLPEACVGVFFYRCVSGAWEIAVGSLCNVSVCVLSVCVGCLGGCLVLLTITVYILFSSVLFFSRICFDILF